MQPDTSTEPTFALMAVGDRFDRYSQLSALRTFKWARWFGFLNFTKCMRHLSVQINVNETIVNRWCRDIPSFAYLAQHTENAPLRVNVARSMDLSLSTTSLAETL
jgi:hypothetical protein